VKSVVAKRKYKRQHPSMSISSPGNKVEEEKKGASAKVTEDMPFKTTDPKAVATSFSTGSSDGSSKGSSKTKGHSYSKAELKQ
jgi:hypothetical protein